MLPLACGEDGKLGCKRVIAYTRSVIRVETAWEGVYDTVGEEDAAWVQDR